MYTWIQIKNTFLDLTNLKKNMIPFTLQEVSQLLNLYKKEYDVRKALYSSHNIKPFVNRPFPNDVSENLVKCFIEQVELRQCVWTVDANHDLFLPCTERKVEVKAFTNDSEQISFTCTQTFDLLYVLDCRKFQLDIYTLHIFEFSSNNMNEMELGMDAIEVQMLNETKRSVRASLKKINQVFRTKGILS